jgi:hypothetical protein
MPGGGCVIPDYRVRCQGVSSAEGYRRKGQMRSTCRAHFIWCLPIPTYVDVVLYNAFCFFFFCTLCDARFLLNFGLTIK